MVRSSAAGQVGRLTAVVLNLTLAMMALWLWARLLQGRLTQPLTLPHALVVSLISAAAAATIRLSWVNPERGESSWCEAVIRWSPTAALLAIAVALTLPGTPVQALLLIWGLAIVEELAVARLLGLQTESRETTDHAAVDGRHGRDPDLIPPQVTQRLTRSRTEAGQDLLVGLLRARFVAHQRTETLHVAFCPPFARVPELQCRQIAGSPARIKATQLLPNGLRLELKLDAAQDDESDVDVEFTAVGGA